MNPSSILSFILIVQLFCSSCSQMGLYTNSGHRAGADFCLAPENSLLALEESCRGRGGSNPLQQRQDFVYLEFDIRETADHELVVFHDSSLQRLICEGTKKLKVRDLTLDEIKNLHLKGWADEKVSTLEEFMRAAIDYGLYKPMVIEIKNIYSINGMEKLLYAIDFYKQHYANNRDIVYEKDFDFPESSVNLMCFSWNLPKPVKKNRLKWRNELDSLGLEGIFMARMHGKRLL